MAKRMPPQFKVTSRRTDRIVTLSCVTASGKRALSVDIRAAPENDYEMQQWFLTLMGKIWWNITDLESLTMTTRVADSMVAELKRHRNEFP